MIKKLILRLTFLFVSYGKAGEIIFEGTGKVDINRYTFTEGYDLLAIPL